MLTGQSVATILLFVLSIILIIRPVMIMISRRRYVPLNLLTAPILVTQILWGAGSLGAITIHDALVGTDGIKPYNILISFLSVAYMSVTLNVTGVPEAAAHWVSKRSGANGFRLYINVYLMVTALSAVLGNNVAILSGTLFLLNYTKAMKLDSKPWLMSKFAAANTAGMILFVGNPTNGVICGGFGIQNAAFTAYMILPFVACSATCLAALIFQYRITKIKLNVVENADPWKYINDPVSAVVGSILLGACMITALVVSFLQTDFWKIALPFAVAKFLFDIFWDLYRTRSEERSANDDFLRGHVTNQDLFTPPEPATLSDPTYPRTNSLPHSKEVNHTFVCHVTSPQKLSNKSHPSLLDRILNNCAKTIQWAECRQPTLSAAFPRLPFIFVPFASSQFILIEALAKQGWIDVFARWLVIASRDQMFPTIWIVGVIGIILCNIAGTNIIATILLTKVVRAAALSPENTRAAGVALALASNIGVVGFVFSASLAGLLWKHVIEDHDNKKDNHDTKNHGREDVNMVNENRTNRITQRQFARWNLIPLLVMTGAGLAVVSAEMAVLHRRRA